jgi:hypothetical protein
VDDSSIRDYLWPARNHPQITPFNRFLIYYAGFLHNGSKIGFICCCYALDQYSA